MSNFNSFKRAIDAQFTKMGMAPLYRTTVSKDEMWATYLASFPEGSDPIHITNTKHNCNCCKQFIRAVGDMVMVKDGVMTSIWDMPNLEYPYSVVAEAMSRLVKSHPIDNIFLHCEGTAGTDKSLQQTDEGVKRWDHFYLKLPSDLVKKLQPGPILSYFKASKDVFKRGVTELTNDAIDTVLELIKQGTLYRGDEYKSNVTKFKKAKDNALAAPDLDLYCWEEIKSLASAVSRIRNTAIGTLLIDLSNPDTDLDTAVFAFNRTMAPDRYKQPTAVTTPAMLKKTQKDLEEKGYMPSLYRRYANINDITINNVVWANRETSKTLGGDVFDQVIADSAVNMKSLAKVEEVSIEKFLSDIVPNAKTLEALVENTHATNFVSLIAPVDPGSKNMFKWDNKFSWSYTGDLADSMKERVKKAGGATEGVLCCRLAWEYDDDLDFHMSEPHGGHLYFSARRSRCGGHLDVDANGGDGMMEHPVENIVYADTANMITGTYTLSVRNFRRRSGGNGFDVEIEFGGQTLSINYPTPVKQGEYVTVADINYNPSSGFSVIKSLASTNRPTPGKNVWGVTTQTYVPITSLMLSPNYWDGNGVGNKHYFFMLGNCKNDGEARGFFNEFLNDEFNEHRKAMGMVGGKLKTGCADNQLSGIGFSSTLRNHLYVKVTGTFNRTIKVMF